VTTCLAIRVGVKAAVEIAKAIGIEEAFRQVIEELNREEIVKDADK
jgi:hypothetical protein